LEPNLAVLPCAEAGAGLVYASGEAIAVRQVAYVPWAEVGANAVLRWTPSERVYLDAALGAFVPVVQRPKFVFDTPLTTLHEVPWIGPIASLAVGARFW
jgi:hypothetical protein